MDNPMLLKRFTAALFACVLATIASAATLLPNGQQTFFGSNGQPLAGGTVTFYLPGTSVLKDTWSDAGQTVLNTNPVVLDSSGRATIYGSGAYRQVVKDALGNLVWDQNTLDTSASSSSYAGTSGGTANAQTLSAPNFTSAAGQTISFVPSLTSTGPFSVILNGANPIGVIKDTANGPTNTVGGEIVAGNLVTIQYDSGLGVFHLLNIPPAPSQIIPPVHYAGEVILMRSTTCPSASVLENGAALSRTTYPQLFAALGTTWGSGDGSTTFNIPDSRGQFDRGWGSGQTVDVGRVFGSSQIDQFQNHTHNSYSLSVGFGTAANGPNQTLNSAAGQYYGTTGATSGQAGSETRPTNITISHCIFTTNTP